MEMEMISAKFWSHLTPVQKRIAHLSGVGLSTNEIAKVTGVSARSVMIHYNFILEKSYKLGFLPRSTIPAPLPKDEKTVDKFV